MGGSHGGRLRYSIANSAEFTIHYGASLLPKMRKCISAEVTHTLA